MIEIKGLTKYFYQKNREVAALQDVSLTVPPGKIYGIIGASGAGKSTLIRCVNLLEKPTSGEVVVNGISLSTLSSRELTRERRQIGMIFQHFNLLSSRTIFDNVAFPLELTHTPKAEIRERVNDLLQLVGLTDKAADYPASLSGGQKQRVAIARTLANNPKVLLCDEATSALDPATTKSILALLKDINRRLGITILLITHEMEVVKAICDYAGILSQGKLIEQGTVSEIFAHPKTGVARDFISSTFHVELPGFYTRRLQACPYVDCGVLIKVQFAGQAGIDVLISEVVNRFHIQSKIIKAQVDSLDEVTFGVVLLELSGNAAAREFTLQYFTDNQLKVEVLGYV
ncbi:MULTISPECIES: methionine ABC transporter ATP-binding protein MetN [Niastella]|uniref:Methionine ABC transporter ATP-binding protein MetN n=1 Tax=Niastella soli TaxID=2821487 RepID=A0ABS3Z266_9BACT|nr:methionine ABC transporter ATP-binding protein MetN [Niastella soli]MBO9204261.1 methionine ABC transporter ATP-binding protein MetN [Niastella soli]